MSDTKKIASEIAQFMPILARQILFEFFQSIDITQTQIFTLMTLSQNAPCRLSELSEKMNVSAPTITGIVDRLEKSGLVKRMPDDNDRRAINVDLTEEGKRLVKKLRITIQMKWEEMLEKIPQEDQENYLRILKKLIGVVR